MIVFKKRLNRYYDTKAKKIISKAEAKKHKAVEPAHKYPRPSYKKLYKTAVKQLKELEAQYSADKFHPFIANQTKDGYVSPESNINDVRAWLKHHTGKLFVVAALGDDDQYIVKACGSVNDLTVAGFAGRDLVPSLVSIFEDGYND